MVTTKGTGLNPNAKVWQEIPTHQSNIPEETEDSSWLLTDSAPAEMTGGYSDIPASGGKGYDIEYPDSTADFAHGATEPVMNSTDHPDLSYLVFDTQGEPAVDGDVNEEQPMSQESLRDSLKKQLESCFSRENLTKDLYLISQMDSDQFVPIWTIASMEDIKALTTDMELIVDVLRGSPLVQVDESGEKVRPNHSRSIIILREVPDTTPVEEVEGLFKSENCPKVLSVEFAHNSNWYITFQSDMDALQAYRYLREEVKMFQGKPIMARIKAINTFFGKNGFRSLDLSAFSQHTQPQAQYSSSVYMQQVYSPQQYSPVYPVVSPSWSPPVVPYFETPLAPFPHSGFVNGFNSSGNYKANSGTINTQRPQSRNRNHIKGPHRPADIPSLCSSTLGSLMDSQSQTPQTSGVPAVPLLSFGPRETPPQATIPAGYVSGAGRGRRGIQRGMRRKREDEQSMKPVPLMEAKVHPPPQFDLAASNFPPLPGSVVGVREETMLEMRLSDVVRGLKVTSKPSSQEVNETRQTDVTEDDVSNANSESTGAAVTLHTEMTQSNPSGCPLIQEKEEKDEPPVPERKLSTSSEHALSSCSQSPEAPSPSPPSPTSEQGLRKLSYAEVCQRPAKDLPPVQTPSPPPPAPSSSQPLQELKVNRVEELRPNSRHTADKPVKSGHSRPPRQPLRSFTGTNGQSRAGGAGQKIRQHQRGLNTGKQFSPQRGTRRSGKEQNIPPRSPK